MGLLEKGCNVCRAINSKTAPTTQSVTLTIGTTSNSMTVQKFGKVVVLPIVMTNTNGFSDFTSGAAIGTLPEGYRPSSSRYGIIACRDTGMWASANYANIVVAIEPDGSIKLYGNETEIKASKYITGSVAMIVV